MNDYKKFLEYVSKELGVSLSCYEAPSGLHINLDQLFINRMTLSVCGSDKEMVRITKSYVGSIIENSIYFKNLKEDFENYKGQSKTTIQKLESELREYKAAIRILKGN